MPVQPQFLIGYATSGLLGHRLSDALELLAELGYRGVLLTLDTHHLDPFRNDFEVRAERCGEQLRRLGLVAVVETGARYLLDPRRKHFPTLMTPDGAEQREEFLRRAVITAQRMGSGWVSLWTGALPASMTVDQGFASVAPRLCRLVEFAGARGVRLALEPEPGMLVQTVSEYHRLREAVASAGRLWLSLDCGHLLVTREGLPPAIILREAAHLGCVAIEDMRHGVHEHLPFGTGDLDLASTVAALTEIRFDGLVAVELGRHSHEGPYQAERSRDILKQLGVPFRETTP